MRADETRDGRLPVRAGDGDDILRPVTRARIIEHMQHFFEEGKQGVIAAYLFGSVARDTHGPDSDVDVAVLMERPPPPTLDGFPFDLETNIESILRRPTRIVVLNDAPADLVHRVLRDGELLLDRDPSRRIRFEVQSRNEYFDLVPHLRRYRRQ